MTRKKFIAEYTRFIQLAMKLMAKAQKQGIISLEEETEDLDDELFKQGLRFVVDGAGPRIIDEIMSNRIAHEKDKEQRILKTIQKRAVLGIQAGEPLRVFYHVLLSLPGLTPKEEKQIEHLVLLRD
jgi:flagellar motor component MotA